MVIALIFDQMRLFSFCL